MNPLHKLWVRIRALSQKRKLDADMDEEMRAHIEMRMRENVQAGMPPDQARYAALRQFGWSETIKETCREQRGVTWLENLVQDVRFGLRMLSKNPGFTIVAVLTLALGIGANTAIFSVVNAVLLRPLPYKEADRLVTIWERNPKEGYEQNNPAAGTYRDWKAQSQAFEQMAVFDANEGFNLTEAGEPMRLTGTAVSADLFPVLGITPERGRNFMSEEEIPGRDQVAILSYNLWQTRFGADPRIVGKVIVLDGKSRTVIGIMPPKFRFPGMTGVLLGSWVNQPADIWVPLALDQGAWNQRGNHYLQAIGRLKRGTMIEQARAEMDTIQQRLEKQYHGNFMGTHTKLVPLQQQSVASIRTALLVLLSAVAFVLLIACANVANLLLARAARRQKEIAIRVALGAGRSRLLLQLLTESSVLAIFGGIVGSLLAMWSVRLLVAGVGGEASNSIPGWNDIRVDTTVLAFTLGISLMTGVLFGLVPAWHGTKTSISGSLSEGGRGSSESRRGNRLRSALVVFEIALALMLLIGAGLMIQSFVLLQKVNPGFNPAHVLAMELDLPDSKYSDDPHRAAFFSQLVERVQALPGVESAAASVAVPFVHRGPNWAINVEGRSADPNGKWLTADWSAITPDYFRAMGVPLVKGRVFTAQDTAESQPVIMINAAFARRYLPGQDPVGKRIEVGEKQRAIVGVATDFRQLGFDAEIRPDMYTPNAQTPWSSSRVIVVRSAGDPVSMMRALRTTVQALDKDLPIITLRSMDTILSSSVAQSRFRTLLMGLFGASALLLATIGIYGVLAYSVSTRLHEIGIRMAIGAQVIDVLSLVIGQGMRLVALGVIIGVLSALALTRVLRSLLYQVAPTDPLTFAAVSLLLVFIALVACWLPARRATKVDPMEALRYE